jgi:hypothetical protein
MRVFLSSTYEDLVEYRANAAAALERLGQQGVRMEVFGARPVEPATACCDEIDTCDAVVGIYAHRYGFVPSGSDASITEQEFRHALVREKRIFCFVVDQNYPWLPRYIETEPGRSRLDKFKKTVADKFVHERFTTPEDLAFKVSASIGRYLITARTEEKLDKIPGRDSVSTAEGRTQVARRSARLQSIVRGGRVLLVNDVPKEMEYVIALLRELGIIVIVATTTREAMTRLNTEPFDAVISDMRRGLWRTRGSACSPRCVSRRCIIL